MDLHSINILKKNDINICNERLEKHVHNFDRWRLLPSEEQYCRVWIYISWRKYINPEPLKSFRLVKSWYYHEWRLVKWRLQYYFAQNLYLKHFRFRGNDWSLQHKYKKNKIPPNLKHDHQKSTSCCFDIKASEIVK